MQTPHQALWGGCDPTPAHLSPVLSIALQARGFFLSLGQVKLVPAPGPLHFLFLKPERMFPQILFDGLLLLCQVLAQMSPPWRGLP